LNATIARPLPLRGEVCGDWPWKAVPGAQMDLLRF